MAILPGVYGAAAQSGPDVPRITFTKTLKGGSPEYIAISVDTSGKGTYESRKSEDASAPGPLQISEGTTAEIFSLAESLSDFRNIDLDIHRKIANMGLKTLIYENGGERNLVQFNYTEKRAAQRLTDIFEKISNVEERIFELQHAVKYDHLGVPQSLSDIEEGLDDNSLVETQLMIPVLEKISNDPHLMHLAQSRARDILKRIRQQK